VFALQPFISSVSAIGAPTTNLQGLTSAFATGMSLVSLSGAIPGSVPAIATMPTATVISLADAMSSCVNSNGSLANNQPCGRLFSAATPTNVAAPTDTVLALIDIARNPSHNAAAIFNTIATQPPYLPGLSRAPADWTLAINYIAPAFSGPSDMAIDGQGTVWVAALPGTGGPGSTTISALTTTGGVTASYVQTAKSYANMAIDVSGNIWLSNTNYSNVVEMTPAGAFLGPFSGGGITGPGPMAFDPAGDLWILNNTTMISELNPSGGATFGSGWTTGAQNGPVQIAIDATGHVWTTDSAGNTVSRLTNQGALVAGAPYAGGGLSSPFAIAIDSANDGWIANRTASTLTEFAGTGAPVSTSYSGDGLLVPIALTLDGANTAWAVNAGQSTISALPAASAGQTGYGSAYLTNPYKIAVDGAGNVWVANVGTSVAGSGVITQIVGAAQPVVTPLSLAVKSDRIAQKP
jgi:streptogramin lyase